MDKVIEAIELVNKINELVSTIETFKKDKGIDILPILRDNTIVNLLYPDNQIKENIEDIEDIEDIEEKIIEDKHKIKSMCYYNKDGKLHNINDKPAIVIYDESGNILEQHWYKNGNQHRENDEPSKIIYDIVNDVVTKYWYKNGVLSRENDEPNIIERYGKHLYIEKWYNQRGELHRKNNNPAVIQYGYDKKIGGNYKEYQGFYENGKLIAHLRTKLEFK